MGQFQHSKQRKLELYFSWLILVRQAEVKQVKFELSFSPTSSSSTETQWQLVAVGFKKSPTPFGWLASWVGWFFLLNMSSLHGWFHAKHDPCLLACTGGLPGPTSLAREEEEEICRLC